MLLANFYRFGAGCPIDLPTAYAITSYLCFDQEEMSARALLDALEMNISATKRAHIQKILSSVKNAQDLLNLLPVHFD